MAKSRIQSVTGDQIVTAFTGVASDVEQAVAERSGSDDKVEAVQAEGAKPKVKTFTTEGRVWIESDRYGLKTEGLYGKKGQTALQPEDLQRHAQFLGAPLGPAELELVHGPDETAPRDGVICPICAKLVTSFVRTALIDRATGDLVRDRSTGTVIYRGQFVAVGPDALNLKVHGAHSGECLFKLRIRRDRDGNAMYETYTDGRGQQRERPMMLDAQAFDQANARVVAVHDGIIAKRDKQAAESQRVREALGFTMNDARRRNPTANESGIDRGPLHTPSTPRGKSRKQRRWVENEEVDA